MTAKEIELVGGVMREALDEKTAPLREEIATLRARVNLSDRLIEDLIERIGRVEASR